MEFAESPLKGAYVVKPKRIEDSRGYFARAWCCDEFEANGLSTAMLQLNVGYSRAKGTVRGMHFQVAPHAEAKFVRCTRGAMYDVIVDLREGSPTRRHWFGIELSADNGTMIYAPEGFAHGYQTLEDDTEMYYFTTARYAPAAAKGVRFDDPALGIAWPLAVTVISEQDRTWPDLQP